MNLAFQRCVALLSASVLSGSHLVLSAPVLAQSQAIAPDTEQPEAQKQDAGTEPLPPSEPLANPVSPSTSYPVWPNPNPLPEPGQSSTDLYTDYLLGPGDQLETRIIGYEDFDWAVTNRIVLSDGTIRIPFVGTVVAAGKTVEALEDEIANRLGLYLTVPVVDMNITGLRPVVVNVVGEVYRPGPVQLGSLTQADTNIGGDGTVTTTATTPNLGSALDGAGGIRRTADIRNVTVRRRMPDGSTREFSVNLWDALLGNSNLGVLVLFDGDTVYVPTATADSEVDPALVASTSIAPDNVRVRVVGEGVVRPGEVQVQPNSSVSSAIAAAGGPNMDAELTDVRVVRLRENGQIEEEILDVSSLVDDYQIQDGDVVFVPKKGYLVGIDNFNRTLGPLLAPIGTVLGILGILNVFGN